MKNVEKEVKNLKKADKIRLKITKKVKYVKKKRKNPKNIKKPEKSRQIYRKYVKDF